ncbi:restriction endonuclease subunit S [Roseateles terrae]|uniref:Type I restriction enzyme S subunit n=1 Tax=Roseateles terrae TaxID=431060 RepID=A0ABR6GXQ9_9BURK|nr:restriction endonuclease subunit S [Roseateles terrae]MBB3196894.1 type I restriction enzyme S subunit [Roseateles terrae]OWQ84558.1 hypothetical protein CDN98_18805 [Roseateles terrae]
MKVLPNGWKTATIAETCDILDNKRKPLNSAQRLEMKGLVPYYGANGVVDYINDYIFDEDLILMAEDGGNFSEYLTRPIAYQVRGKSWVNNHAHVLRAKPQFDQDYLFYSLEHKDIQPVLNGGTRAKLNKSELEKIELLLPVSFEEQRQIATMLTAVDDKLDVIARQIEATQTLKQGLMQTLFSRGLGTRSSDGTWAPHTHLHHIDGRELPRAWGAATLGAYIAELRSGVSVNAEDRGLRLGEVGVLKVSSVQGGRFLPSNHKTVVPMEVDRVAEPVQEGCIIISRANTPTLVGESAYVVKSCPELFLPDKLWQTRPTIKAHSTRWLAFYLQSPAVRQEVQKAATGTSGSMKNISKASLLSIFMPLVPLEEQHHIADLLGAVTSKIDALEAKHRHYQTLKRGLMQKLLTGEWRVKVDAELAA